MRYALVLCLLLVLPGPLWAQAGQDEATRTRAGAAAAVLLKGGAVAGSSRMMIGGWGGLVFGDHFLLAGGGLGLSKDVEIPGSGLSTGFDLGMGYGGVFLKYWEDLSGGFTAGAGLFVGAGHAEVRGRLLGNELGADNFLVLEPEASLAYGLFRGISLEVAAGYRIATGVEDLPTVTESDFRALTGTLLLRVGGR